MLALLDTIGAFLVIFLGICGCFHPIIWGVERDLFRLRLESYEEYRLSKGRKPMLKQEKENE
ncbi:hypothetical protein [Streptococcus merionis]|uniref:hypothetical protein n=1 Tax=Streptococcus merionis TaxID=400065 RepID=UPI0026F17565|nr:hypothetical protein [Streptococcus merionis]